MSAPVSDARKLRHAVVGLVVLGLLLALAATASRIPLFDGSRTYRALFADASGLATGEEVRIAGVKVGTVTAIELAGTAVAVEFTVDGVRLGDRSSAAIEIKTLLGQHYLSVVPAGRGELEDDTIALTRTTAPFDIVPALQGLATEGGAIDAAQLGEAFDQLATTLDAAAPEVGAAIEGLGRLSRTISTRDEDLRRLFQQTAKVSGVVADRDADIGELLVSTDRVLAELQRRRVVINQIIDQVRGLSAQVSALVAEDGDALTRTLASLKKVVKVLRGNRKQLDEVIRLGELYGREFVNVSGTGPWFDATVKFPQSYSVCAADSLPSVLSSILGPVLGSINQSVNGSSKPCLPLGPAVEAP
ncbi:MCE family protein [Nocardioides sp. LML1-1-1.1]|uniref:MCE family protein n=1 Tax=Nocardioides sp. LML1-1-1.1 TaxID=3135248 RepID=UPI003443823A